MKGEMAAPGAYCDIYMNIWKLARNVINHVMEYKILLLIIYLG